LLTANKIVGAPGTLSGISKNGYLVLAEDGYLLLESGERIILENNPLLLSFKSVGADGLLHRTHAIPLDPVTQAIIDRMTTAGSTPSEKYQTAMDKWIKREIANGNYAKSDSWYVFEVEDKIQASINWKDANYNPTEPVTCPFIAGVGYKSDGAGYLDANFGPNDGLNFSINDNTIVFYTPDSGGLAASRILGVRDGTRNTFIQFHTATSGFYANWTNGINESISFPASNGLWAMDRSAANTTTMYRDNTVEGSSTDVSSSYAWTRNFYLCAYNDNGIATRFDTVHTLGFSNFGSSGFDLLDMGDGHDQFLIDIL